MFKNYFITAWRNLIKRKTSSVINILGLSLGLTCSILTFLFIEYELSFDRYHEKADRTYRVVEEQQFGDDTYYFSNTAFPLATALRNDFSEFDFVAQSRGITKGTISLDDGYGKTDKYEEGRVLFVDPNYLKVFDHQWVAGDPETALNESSSIVLTSSIAEKYFGEQAPHEIVGKVLLFDGQHQVAVTGIVADPPSNSTMFFSMLLPLDLYRIMDPYHAQNWSGNYDGTTFVVLPANIATQGIEKKIASWKGKYLNPEDNSRKSYSLQPLIEAHTDEQYINSPGSYTMPKKYLGGALIVGLFIMALACINFVNLATANASNRAKEVGVRKTMGGKRKQLIFQFLIENMILTGLAIIVALTTTQYLATKMNDLLSTLHMGLTFGLMHVIIIVGFGFLLALIAGFYPAYIMSSFKPAFALRNTDYNKNSLLRRVLVVFQFTIIQVMIISTLVVASQMSFILEKDLGYEENAVLMSAIPNIQKIETFRQKLITNPSIVDVAFGSGPPTSGDRRLGTRFRLPHQPEGEGIGAEMKGVGLRYLDFYQIELVAGRNFMEVKERFDEFIVNENLIKTLGWKPEEAIGKKLAINEGEATIVGVVKDFHNSSFQESISPCVLVNWSFWLDVANIKYNTHNSNVGQTINYIEDQWRSTFPMGVFNHTFLEDYLEKNYQQEQLIFDGFKVFSFIAIFIGCLGLFGMIQFIALRRTKEIGVRKILGATAFSLVSLLSSEFFRLITVAFIIACPIGYYFMNDWLQGFVYSINLSWQLFILSGLGALVITFLTVSYQTMKTARANPVEALRYE